MDGTNGTVWFCLSHRDRPSQQAALPGSLADGELGPLAARPAAPLPRDLGEISAISVPGKVGAPRDLGEISAPREIWDLGEISAAAAAARAATTRALCLAFRSKASGECSRALAK